VQQGDPLGPALYALTLQPIVVAMRTRLNIWYLDDGTVSDDPNTVLTALTTVKEIFPEGADIGLHLNPRKSEVAFLCTDKEDEKVLLGRFEEEPPGIVSITDESATLLGSPLTKSALRRVLGEKTATFSKFSKHLGKLSSQSPFLLPRASISIPRLVYFLRCAPAWKEEDQLSAYDKALRQAMEAVLNCRLEDDSWDQATLPVKQGGVGVRCAMGVALPSFLASTHGALPLLAKLLPAELLASDSTTTEAEEAWVQRTGVEPPPVTKRTVQQEWDEPMMVEVRTRLLSTASSAEDKARLLASDQPEAGAWLGALPSPQLGTWLPDESFRVTMALRVGAPMCHEHKCGGCGAPVTAKGLHGLACKKSAGRHMRHSDANDVLSRALTSANVCNIREPIGCFRSDGKRPDGLTINPWKGGLTAAWDYTTPDTYAKSHLGPTSTRPGAAAAQAETKKRRKYASLENRHLFFPVAVETSGVWGEDGLRWVRQIGTRITATTGEKRATSFLFQRMSIAVQRGNVASILGTMPQGKTFKEIFLLTTRIP